MTSQPQLESGNAALLNAPPPKSGWMRYTRGRSAMALADQVLISGSNFAANIVLVRALGLHEYGKYAIAFMLLLYVNAVQMSFVTSPMLSLAPQLGAEEKRRFVDGMYAVQVLASVGALVVGLIAGLVASLFTPYYSVPCVLAFAFTVGTFQLQDWLRRYYFVYNKPKFTLLSDFLSYFVQLAVFVVLWRMHTLTLFTTFVIMGVTSLAGFLVGPITDRLTPAMDHLREAWKQCRTMSRDLFVANQVRWFGLQGVLLIGTGIIGTAGAGGLRATLSLSGPMNLVLTAIENVMPIRMAEELKKNGAAGAFALTQKAIFAGAAIFALVALPIAIFGHQILRLLYGPAMAPFYWPMVLQLACLIVQVASNLYVYFYRSVRDTRPVMRAYAVNAVASLVTVYAFGRLWDATGIVLSSLAGMLAGVAYFVAYWAKHRMQLLESHPAQMAAAAQAATGGPQVAESVL